MTSLFVLQMVCCTVTTLMALLLAMSSLQMRWRERRYEVSRWTLFTALSILSIHYLLQMTHGLRAQGADVGAAFNILFYTPVAFAIVLSVINLQGTAHIVRRYCLRSAAAYGLIVGVFAVGVAMARSFHLGYMLYVMLGLFVASMGYFVYVIRLESARRKRWLLEVTGADLSPFKRFSQASLTLVNLTAAFLCITILFNKLLVVVGPLMLFSVVFFVYTFISLGYYIVPREPMAEAEEEDFDDEAYLGQGCGTDGTEETETVATDRVGEIEARLARWCEERCYKNCNASIYTLAADLGCRKNELTEYFNQSAHTNFRTWLSDIRFNEAVRMMRAYPDYSNDAISTECGFSSHTQIYRIFKQKTGMSPNQWRDTLEEG